MVVTIAKTLKTELLRLQVPKQNGQKKAWNILGPVKTKNFSRAGAEDAWQSAGEVARSKIVKEFLKIE